MGSQECTLAPSLKSSVTAELQGAVGAERLEHHSSLGYKARGASSNKRSLKMRNVKPSSLLNHTYGLLFDLGLLLSHLVPGFPVSPLMSCVIGKAV